MGGDSEYLLVNQVNVADDTYLFSLYYLIFLSLKVFNSDFPPRPPPPDPTTEREMCVGVWGVGARLGQLGAWELGDSSSFRFVHLLSPDRHSSSSHGLHHDRC